MLVPNLLPLVFDVLRQCGVVAEVGSSVCVLFSLSLINQQGSLATGHVVNRYSASETMALGSPFSETVSFVWLVNVSLAAVQLPSSTMSSNASAIFCANCWCLDSRRCHNRPRPCPQSRPYTGARWPLEDRKAPPYRRLWHPRPYLHGRDALRITAALLNPSLRVVAAEDATVSSPFTAHTVPSPTSPTEPASLVNRPRSSDLTSKPTLVVRYGPAKSTIALDPSVIGQEATTMSTCPLSSMERRFSGRTCLKTICLFA